MSLFFNFCQGATVVVLFVGLLGYAYMLGRAYLLSDEKSSNLRKMLEENAPAAIWVPVSAAASFGIVSLLQFGAFDKSLTFKAFSLSFEGPAAPVTIWVVCFLAFVAALRLVAK